MVQMDIAHMVLIDRLFGYAVNWRQAGSGRYEHQISVGLSSAVEILAKRARKRQPITDCQFILEPPAHCTITNKLHVNLQIGLFTINACE